MNGQTCSLLDEEFTYTKGGNNMKTKMKKLIKNQKGMTLIELLAVVVIIAIIAAIAIPAIMNIINNQRDKAIMSDAVNIISTAKTAAADGVCKPEGTSNCTNAGDTPNTEFSDMIEGATGTYTVTKSGNTWSIVYSQFGQMKKAHGDVAKVNTESATESELQAALGK